MNKKRITITVGISVIAVILVMGLISYMIYSLNNTEPESSPELVSYTEEKVETFLTEEKGYTKEEIKSIESTRAPKSSDTTASGYDVEVIFSDEPDVFYYYEVEENKVQQFGLSGDAKKHIDRP